MSPILVIAVLMIALWLLSLALRDASVIDPGWGLGFVLVAWAEWLRDDSNLPVALLPLVTIWGLRLAGYLFYRKLKEPSEDRRYKSMREKHGGNFWWISLFTVFLLQGVIMYVVSLPLLNGLVEDPRSLNLLLAGTALWFVGLVFEPIQSEVAEQRPSARHRLVALHAASELLRRFLRMVGHVGGGIREWSAMVDDYQPTSDERAANESLGRDAARERH